MNEKDPLGLFDAPDDNDPLGLFSSTPKRDTTLTEDFKIGLHNAAAPVVKFAGMVPAAAASYVGATDTADKIYGAMEDQLKSMEDYWVPKDVEQKTFGGKAASVISTLPAQLVSFPFSPADTGKTLVDAGEDGSWNGSAQGGAALDTLGNVAGVALPGAIGGNLFKKFVTGAGINALQDSAVRQAISAQATTEQGQKAFEPTLESAGLSAMVGGPMGMLSPSKPVAKNDSPAPKLDKTDPSLKTDSYVPSVGEMQMLQMVHRNTSDSLKVIEQRIAEVNELVEEGNTSQQVIDAMQELSNKHKELSKTLADIENIFADPTRIPESLFVEAALQDDALMNKAKERRKVGRPMRQPDQSPTLEDTARRGGDQPKEVINKETGEIIVKEPKKSPVEVALIKISQAENMNQTQLKKRWEDTVEALQLLEDRAVREGMPGEEYNSLKASIEAELKAYEDIRSGHKPDLSWFEGKEKPVEDIQPEVKQNESYDEYLARTTSEDKPLGDLHMDEDNYQRYLTMKYGAPEEVRTQHEVLDKSPTREPIELPDGSFVDPDLRGNQTRTAAQALQHHSYEGDKLSRILENVNKQIASYEAGQTPSGTFDVAKAIETRSRLESQIEFHREALENVLKNSPDVKTNVNKSAGKYVEPTPIPVEKYASVGEAIQGSLHNLVDAFHNNLDLFNSKKNSNVFFDKNIPQEIARVMNYFVDKLGLTKEKVFFVFDDTLNAYGRARHYGNTTVVFINRKAVTDKMSNKTFGTLRVAAHEIGHFLFNKYLQTHITHVSQLENLEQQFEAFKNKHVMQPNFKDNLDTIVQRQEAFHEFFAERTAKALMYKHALGAFAAKSKYLQAFSKLLEQSWNFVNKTHSNFNKQMFVDDIINHVLEENSKSIEATGKTLFEKMETERNDKAILANRDPDAYPFFNKTLEETRNIVAERGWTHNRTTKGDEIALSHDIVPISLRAARALGSGATYLTTKFFGKTGVAQIFRDNPVIQDVYWKIRDAEQKASSISNKLWFGDVSRDAWNEAGVIAKMSKVKDGSSPYMIVKNSKPEDMAAVHDVFKQGIENNLEYHESLDKFGANLTKDQQQIFKSLASMFTEQYKAIVKEQETLGKKNILPRRKGWYPSVRRGDYYVDISYQGMPAYRQHFTTEAEGRAFIEKLGEGNLKYLSTTGVEKVKVDDNGAFLDAIDSFKDFLGQKYPQAGGVLKKDIENYVNSIITRGGKLGKHHNYRMNLQGYKGSEMFLNDKDRGNSFKEAIQSSVGDYTGTLRKMMINHYVDPILRNGNLEQTNPNTYQVIQQMSDSALNRVENKMEMLDAGVRNGVDTIAKSLYDIAGKDFKPGDPIFDKIKNNVLETFYLMKLMAKPVFAIGQLMTTPVQAIRHMAYDGGFRAYWSFGKGLSKLALGDAELKDSMFRVSQTTNVFEPQFIEALHLNKNDSSIVEGIKKWVFLNKVNEAADSASRALTYAAMYEHYKSLGNSTAKAEKLAMHGTDSTMVQYGRSEQAPIFQHTGIVGEMIRPLQTFGQAQLANIISDIRHFETMKPSTWAPLLTYGLMATAVGGVLSAQFIQEYEIIRKWLAAKYPEYAPPSILDLVAHDDSFMDRILPDNDAARHAMLFGLPSLSGVDLSSSVRANETFATLTGSVLLAEENWIKLFPLISFGVESTSGASTLIAKAMGKSVTAGETAKAITQLAPVGPVAYGAKELAGVNTTVIGGERTNMMPLGNTGDAGIERTPTDVVAGVLGTKSTNDRITTLAAVQRTADDKNRQMRIKRLADLAIETGNPEYIEKIVSLNVTPEALKNTIGSELYNRLMDVDTRYIVNSKGTAPVNAETARKATVLGKFRRTGTE